MLKTLEEQDVVGKRVIVRVDFNVAVENGKVVDDLRIRAALPTLQFLKESGASAILLLAHRGRPKGLQNPELSLAPIAEHLRTLWNGSVQFVSDCIGEMAEEASRTAPPQALLLFENLRFHEGEEKNDEAFAQQLSRLGSFYVNDAFGDAHRSHASIVSLPKTLPSAAGLLLQREAVTLAHIRDNPERPFVAVLGGAKVSDKLLLVEKLLPKVSDICVGGVLANTVLKAEGFSVGRSLVDDGVLDRVRGLPLLDTKLHVPIDVLVSTEKKEGAPTTVRMVQDVRNEEMILDIGPKTQQLFHETIVQAKTVFWNGPMGLAEVAAFRSGTDAVARSIAEADGFTAIGGGDTTRYPAALGLSSRIDFLSTGGGAMLEYLSGAVLPGLSALERQPSSL